MLVAITIVLQLRGPKLSWFFFCIPNLLVRVSVPIAIVLQSGRLELFHLSLFIFVMLLPSF
jgi:hypothetical protein